jgi:hypothetical protein
MTEAETNTATLRAEFDKVCKEANVFQGIGPPIAYFSTPDQKRFIYVSFGMSGQKPEGKPMNSAETFAEVLTASIATFREWLQHQSHSRMETDAIGRSQRRWKAVGFLLALRSIG